MLPQEGRDLVKRLVLGVRKIDWTTYFDIVVHEPYRGEALATASLRGSLRLGRLAQRRGTFETRIERYKRLCYRLVE